MKLEYPSILAAEVAAQLDNDPVMAAQIKEHLSDERLRKLLDLPSPVEDLTDEEILKECFSRLPLSEVQKYYRTH